MSANAAIGMVLLGVISLVPRALRAAEPVIVVGTTESETSAAVTALIKLAAQRYDEGRYDEALSALQAARATSPRPGILYNIGQVQRARHDCVAALEAYRSFLALTPASDPNHDRALRWQTEMQTCVDEKAPGPGGGTVPAVPSGGETNAIGAEVAQPVLVPAAVRTALPRSPGDSVLATVSNTPPAPTPARRTSTSTLAGVSLLGAGAIAAGAALWYALAAFRIQNDLDHGTQTGTTFVMRSTDGDRAVTRARWFGALGGVLAGSGGAVLLLGRPAAPAGTPVALFGWGGEF